MLGSGKRSQKPGTSLALMDIEPVHDISFAIYFFSLSLSLSYGTAGVEQELLPTFGWMGKTKKNKTCFRCKKMEGKGGEKLHKLNKHFCLLLLRAPAQ